MALEYDLEWSVTSLGAILRVCERPGRILALMQDNPDPDSIASALAFCELIQRRVGKDVTIGYGGAVGRAENEAMLEFLHVKAHRFTSRDLDEYPILCLVDTQPFCGNNICLRDRPVQIVIDHHATPSSVPWTADVADVRPHYGATSTILFEYLLAGHVEIDPDLATALFYGIQSDTQDLGRQTSPADVAAFQALFQIADKKKLARIRHAPVPVDYFRMLHDALGDSVVAGPVVITRVRADGNPDMIAEIAELMMRLRGTKAAVCYGLADETIYLSVRTFDARFNVGKRIREVTQDIGRGGGHRMMAGGQIPAGDDPQGQLDEVHRRIVRVFARGKKPKPLL